MEHKLKRELGVWSATMMGLGSIVGTGVFVGISLATESVGAAVVLAIMLAGCVAVCNALSSAQLAASHPTSGGTYEYAYVYLTPTLGFSAGWLFLCAKSASAASAALGFAGYVLTYLSLFSPLRQTALALLISLVLSALVVSGMRRTALVNSIVVAITISALVGFIVAGLPDAVTHGAQHLTPFFGGALETSDPSWYRFLNATALMFVAYTGYGRIATLGEEVRNPEKTIPKAILLTVAISMALYCAVAVVGVAASGVSQFSAQGDRYAAPLSVVAAEFTSFPVASLVTLGAISAMAGVLLNLILGLSRVVLAMARRGDMPPHWAAVNARTATPIHATIVVTSIILVLVSFGSIRFAWSLSAFTVLVYYAVTNLAALRLPRDRRLYPVVFAWIGLIGCLFLACWIELHIFLIGSAILAIGHVVRVVVKRSGRQG